MFEPSKSYERKLQKIKKKYGQLDKKPNSLIPKFQIIWTSTPVFKIQKQNSFLTLFWNFDFCSPKKGLKTYKKTKNKNTIN